MKFTVYPSAQLKAAALRDDIRDCGLAVAAGVLSTGALVLLMQTTDNLLLRGVLAGDAVICAAVAVFYAGYGMRLRGRLARLQSEVRHE
jgi:hypothetical protein